MAAANCTCFVLDREPKRVLYSAESVAQAQGFVDARTDVELLTEFREGHSDAFGELVRRYRRLIFIVSLRHLNHAENADDVTQQTFLDLMKRPEGFDISRGNLKAYLVGMARHRCLRLFDKRAKRHRILLRAAQIARGKTADRTPLESAISTEANRRLAAAFKRLSTLESRVVNLRFTDGLRLREIGETLGFTRQRAHEVLNRAIAKLA